MVSRACHPLRPMCQVFFVWCVVIIFLSVGCVASDNQEQDGLVWVKSPPSTALLKGDDLVLACEVRHVEKKSYSPSLIYSWTNDGGPIPVKASMFSNHSLFVPRMTDKDWGQYTCKVTTDKQDGVETKASANVMEAYLDPFLIEPQSQLVKLGNSFVLTCVTGPSAPHLEVYWMKDEKRFDGGTQMSASFGDFDPDGLRRQTSMRLEVVASADTAGLYQCGARNQLLAKDSVSQRANISLESVPSNLLPVIEWNVPETLVIAEGQDLTLDCKSQVSTEPVLVDWFWGRYLVDESKRVYVLPNSSLTFQPLSARDKGFYHCQARNSRGKTKSPAVQLVIAYLGIQFQEEPSDTFALYGQEVVLKCQPPDSLPKAKVTWYKDFAIFDITSIPSAEIVDGHLHFDAVTKSDKGQYYCVASNAMTHPSSRTSRVVRLTIEGPPQMTQPPSRVRLLKGSLLHLECLAESDPSPIITWTFDGRSLSGNQDVTIMNGGQELWITNVGKPWEGEFTCLCTNKYGSIAASASVTVLVLPVSLHPLGLMTVTSGWFLIIPCPVDGFPMPSIDWFHNGTQIASAMPQTTGQDDLDWRRSGLNLIIDQATPDYSGSYKCVARNEAGTVTSSGSLVVYVPPYFVDIPVNMTKVIIGHQAVLSCQVHGNAPPSIHWLLNGSLPVRGQLSTDNSTLTFASVGWEDVGVYTCVAVNLVGTAKRNVSIAVMVPPAILFTSHPDSPVRINSQLILSCGASGLPTPTIIWIHQDTPLSSSLNGRVRFPMTGMLVIESLLEKDAGVYQCKAESVAGSDTVAMSVRVYGRPSPPTLLAAVPLSSTSVYILWELSNQHTDDDKTLQNVDTFTVFYKEKSSPDEKTYPDIFPSNMTRVEVMSLKPGTLYVFSVKASNNAGVSEASNPMTATTFHDAPSPPTHLRVVQVTGRMATVSLEPPASPNGHVKLYQLRYNTYNVSTPYEVIDIDSPTFPTQEVSISSLRPDFSYTVQARAATMHEGKQLWGNFSSPLIVRTKMADPSLAPQFVKAVPVDANSMEVTWEPIPELGRHGPLTAYVLSCCDDQKKLVSSHTITPQAGNNRKIVYGLSPWRRYWFEVKGKNSIGFGPASEAVAAKTLPIAPVSVPQDLSAVFQSSSTITLSWKPVPPASVTCNVTGYSVKYRKKVQDVAAAVVVEGWSTLYVPSNQTQFNITDLSPWTEYECCVAAFTNTVTHGLGPYTEPVGVTTLQGESSPVTALSFISHSTFVSLSWKPPLDVKGNLVGYSITYHPLNAEEALKASTLSADYTNIIIDSIVPDTIYNVSIAAINEDRKGETIVLLIQSLPPRRLVPPANTMFKAMVMSTEDAGNEIEEAIISTASAGLSLQEKDNEQQSHLRKNLAPIVAGSIVGTIALTIFVIFVCAQCKKYRKNQRMSYAYYAYFNQGYTTQVL